MKKFYFRLLSVCILIVLGINANGQNCTVNAGISQNLCPTQPFTLTGTATGVFAPPPDGPATWTQISGPAVILGTPVISGNTINVPITGYSLGNTYVFRLTAKCLDGTTVFQNVTFTTLVATVASAGPDISGCPGTQVLAGSALGVGETGQWTTVSGPGLNVSPSNSPTGTVSLPSNTSGVSTLRWTVTNSNGCSSFDQMTVTNSGGQSPVTVPADITLSHCYTTTTQTPNWVFASYGGNGTGGQQGLWTFISGPNTPVITWATNYYTQFANLIEGTYRFRWTVSGPCVNGFDEIDIMLLVAQWCKHILSHSPLHW